MEEQVLQLLQDTTKPDTETIRNAEQGLLSLYPQPHFPFALLTIATHTDIDSGSRKAALTALKSYVGATWSPQFDETFTGNVYLDENTKGQLRDQVLAICTSNSSQSFGTSDSNVQALAAGVVSKIATVDFPESWPTLFQSLVNVLNTSSTDLAVHGALRVLNELVDSGLTEDQFFQVARDLVSALHSVAVNSNYNLMVRALSLNVFQGCFEMLEMVMADHGPAVKGFLDESVKTWMRFFIDVLREPLPQVSSAGASQDSHLRGVIALKVQAVKTVDKLRKVYIAGVTSHVMSLFQTVWEDLARLTVPYDDFFVEGNEDGKLIDSDNLPCSLDALVLEEIDFLQVLLKAPTVKKQLQDQSKQPGQSPHTVAWLQELIGILMHYACIPKEEEALWEYDANLYLCETSSITANYTPRAACADLLVRTLGEWLKQTPVKAMLHFNMQSNTNQTLSWKHQESLLFLLSQSIRDLDEVSTTLDNDASNSLLEQVSSHLQSSNAFVRAATHLLLGSFFKIAGKNYFDAAASSFANTVQCASSDDSDVVKVACLSIIPEYIQALPANSALPQQQAIFDTISEFISSHDLRDDLEDADDVKAAMIVALRDATMLDTSNIANTTAVDIFFTLASDGAANFVLFQLLTETFEGLVSSVTSHGHDAYVRLCAKTIPSLTGAFDVANMTQESALTNLAAELVSSLAEYGSEPLPDGFVPAVMPKLQRVLMEATEAELVRPATTALQYMLTKGISQFMQWNDASGTSALEVTLTIINRLLNSPEVDENAGQEVGGLASSLVTKYGADKLGPYLGELLRAVAIRLATAEQIQFIQSLCMVFVVLTIETPKDVIQFLSEVTMPSSTNPTTNDTPQSALPVILTKWLENSIHFAGFDEVRQNTIALSKIFSLEDPRISQIGVKGDLIVENTGRIKTRSQAKLNPDRYGTISAELKILKLMVDELSAARNSAFGSFEQAQAAAAAAGDSDVESVDGDGDGDGDDDGEWEDVAHSGALDLGTSLSKNELMALGGEFGDDGAEPSPTGSRARDDETADYLLNWFRQEAAKPRFQTLYDQLSADEKGKLNALA